MKLSKMFSNCAWNIKYEEAGLHVNYAFREEGRRLFIYFQGSEDIKADGGWIDWLRNFLFFPITKKPYKGMKETYRVHRGFLMAWKEIEDIIISKITEKELRNVLNKRLGKLELRNIFKYDDITIIGYSHGGALAMLATEAVWFHRPDLRDGKMRGYGFEAPRVFSGFWVRKSLRERWKDFTVIRTNNDLVTHMPPVLLGFRHVGKMLKIEGDASMVEGNLPKCIKSHFPGVVFDALLKHEDKEGC